MLVQEARQIGRKTALRDTNDGASLTNRRALSEVPRHDEAHSGDCLAENTSGKLLRQRVSIQTQFNSVWNKSSSNQRTGNLPIKTIINDDSSGPASVTFHARNIYCSSSHHGEPWTPQAIKGHTVRATQANPSRIGTKLEKPDLTLLRRNGSCDESVSLAHLTCKYLMRTNSHQKTNNQDTPIKPITTNRHHEPKSPALKRSEHSIEPTNHQPSDTPRNSDFHIQNSGN